MDSMDLEREKGITILAKNTAVRYGDVKINIVDTPGHADFGGEVERGLSMVDGVLLLVDASEGPLPQTRFVLRKALEARLPVILVVNKVDRPDARVAEVVARGRGAVPRPRRRPRPARLPDRLLRRPRGPGLARPPGRRRRPARGRHAQAAVRPAGRAHPGARPTTPRHPLQALVTNLDASPYVGRLALCRVRSGDAAQGPDGGLVPGRRHRSSGPRSPSCTSPRRSTGSRPTRPGRARSSPSPASPRSPSARRWPTPTTPGRCRSSRIDEPSLSMTIGINTSPLAGREGTKLTARLVKSRLDQPSWSATSASGSLPTERPDTWEVQGRGELQLAVLVEMMRREGFELTVGKPQVLTREIDGKRARAGRPGDRRRARGVPRRGHPAAGPAQGPHGADRQPRHRLGAARAPGARPGASSASAPSC